MADQLHGVGPKPGIIEISPRAKSTVAFKRHLERSGRRPNQVFLYDPATNTCVFAQKAEVNAIGGHQRLAESIGRDTLGTGGAIRNLVGGEYSLGPQGQLLTDEASGHYGRNWNPEIRAKFQAELERMTGLKVEHTPWEQ
jgi:filamentous hemagglutinin